MNEQLTPHDIAHLRQVYDDEVLPAILDETYDGPAIAMTSVGYVNVWSDGEVTSFGGVIHTLDVD
jgi:hypothetical protein